MNATHVEIDSAASVLLFNTTYYHEVNFLDRIEKIDSLEALLDNASLTHMSSLPVLFRIHGVDNPHKTYMLA